MIVKLAQFSTEVDSSLEKEAGLWGAIKERGAKSLSHHELTQIVDEIAKKKDLVKNYGIGRAEYVGKGAKGVLGSVLGGDAVGAAGKHTNAAIEHIKRNAAAYGGGALLAGGGALAYNRSKKK